MNGTKPLIKSGVTIRAIVTIIATIAAATWGVDIDELTQQDLVTGGIALAGIIGMVHSRYKADTETKGIFRSPKE